MQGPRYFPPRRTGPSARNASRPPRATPSPAARSCGRRSTRRGASRTKIIAMRPSWPPSSTGSPETLPSSRA